MRAGARARIGFLSTWPIYQGTTMDRHAQALLDGIEASARDHDCELLVAGGISAEDERARWRTAWSAPGAGSHFVPVGPWNTDGLIVVADNLGAVQRAYVRDLQRVGFPVVFTTPEGPGPRVSVDNRSGIREAIGHLVEHGHRQIAFVAGTQREDGDSAERLQAYRDALVAHGIDVDPARIAHGDHRHDGGRRAMERIITAGRPFTAFVASNDLSCLGAIEALRAHGRTVPDDVAAIGFDDILDARSRAPMLTTVRHPTFKLGYEALVTVLHCLAGSPPDPARVIVPTRLIVRRSCGCGRDGAREAHDDDAPEDGRAALAHHLADAAFREAIHTTREDLQVQSQALVGALLRCLESGDDAALADELTRLLAVSESRGEDPHVWQSAVSALLAGIPLVRDLTPEADPERLTRILEDLRIEVAEHVQRRTTRALLEHVDRMSLLGLLTAQLIAAQDLSRIGAILAEHLPRLGIEHLLACLYRGDSDDPHARAEVLLAHGLPIEPGTAVDARGFLDALPAGLPEQVVVLPLTVDDEALGFAVLPAAAIGLAGAIATNLATAIRASSLYSEAVEGRALAEDASRVKTRFLSTVSHELRTPLSIVVGLSDVILRESRDANLSSTIVRDLEHLATSAQHLSRLIGDVLDLASSEAGALRLVRQPLDVSEVLLGVCLAGEQMAHERGLTWTASLPDPAPIVSADRTRLRQVVLNLLSNAVKFTPRGGIRLEAGTTDESVEIRVVDTGSGVAVDDQKRIFEEFYRAETSQSGAIGGMGIGLAVARQIVERHGGTIGVRSSGVTGEGSVFFFSLPRLDRVGAVVAAPAAQPGVLFLLSRATTDRSLEQQLTERGYRVEIAVAEATTDLVDLVAERRPVAVIIDTDLAADRGWDLVRGLRALGGLDDVSLLAHRFDPESRDDFVQLDRLLRPLEAAQLGRLVAGEGQPGDMAASGVVPRVLVVDDDADVRRLHARILEGAGLEAHEAADGPSALALIDTQPPDLVLLDLAMPGMDGFAVLEAIRSRPQTRETPVIVLTGKSLDDADVDRLNDGGARLLNKGVLTGDETIRLIDSSLTPGRTLSETTGHLVRRATAYIEANHARAIGRDEIARHVAMSPDYLTDCFRHELGITPMTYLSRYRISKARDLLDHSSRSITDVALSVGFSDISHFTRTFHREVGASPRAYRHRAVRASQGAARRIQRCRGPKARVVGSVVRGIRQEHPGR